MVFLPLNSTLAVTVAPLSLALSSVFAGEDAPLVDGYRGIWFTLGQMSELGDSLERMNFLQLSLLHVPAVVIHGNTLTLQAWSHWYTPAHILGEWQWKLGRGQ